MHLALVLEYDAGDENMVLQILANARQILDDGTIPPPSFPSEDDRRLLRTFSGSNASTSYAATRTAPLLLVRNGRVTPIEENGLMLAAFDFASYSTAVHKLETDDRIVMYTHGLVEASNAAGDFFGHDAFCDLLTRTRELSPQWRQTRSFLLLANGRENRMTI